VTKEFAPLFSWTTSWNSGINTTLSYNKSNGEDDTQFNNVFSTTESYTKSLRLNGRYSFSAPRGISILGKRIRFRSDMTLNFDFDRSEDKIVEAVNSVTGASTNTVRSHKKSLNIKPRATYNFSKKIQGSLDVGYSRTKDLQRERTDTTILVALEALIKF
jgi:cell surface protein SprA